MAEDDPDVEAIRRELASLVGTENDAETRAKIAEIILRHLPPFRVSDHVEINGFTDTERGYLQIDLTAKTEFGERLIRKMRGEDV